MLEVYVQLFDEGTIVYRPVPATLVAKNACVLGGYEIHSAEIETWEFPPGSHVMFEERMLEGEVVLVAARLS